MDESPSSPYDTPAFRAAVKRIRATIDHEVTGSARRLSHREDRSLWRAAVLAAVEADVAEMLAEAGAAARDEGFSARDVAEAAGEQASAEAERRVRRRRRGGRGVLTTTARTRNTASAR